MMVLPENCTKLEEWRPLGVYNIGAQKVDLKYKADAQFSLIIRRYHTLVLTGHETAYLDSI